MKEENDGQRDLIIFILFGGRRVLGRREGCFWSSISRNIRKRAVIGLFSSKGGLRESERRHGQWMKRRRRGRGRAVKNGCSTGFGIVDILLLRE